MGSVWALAAGAVVVDGIALLPGLGGVRWVNYAIVRLAFHQLGHAWRYGGLGGPRSRSRPWPSRRFWRCVSSAATRSA